MVSESEYKCQNGETVFWKCDDILCFDDCFNSTWKKQVSKLYYNKLDMLMKKL